MANLRTRNMGVWASRDARGGTHGTHGTHGTRDAGHIDSVPAHVGIIMDGNGRWASKRGAIASVGHKAGIDALQRTVEGCVDLGVKYLSVFALSTENSTNRTAEEVSFLIRLVRSVVSERLDRLHNEGVELRFIGDVEGIGDPELSSIIREAESLTAGNETLVLTVALNFSGTEDIVRTTKAIAQRVLDGLVDVEDINAAMISDRLSMGHIAPENREPDLLIRTGGEQRISNFMLWELAFSELYFTDVYWPDFSAEELRKACLDFESRERRFGLRP
jgi:undecaprenyl diphosphate synthase